MNDITEEFRDIFVPFKGIVVYQKLSPDFQSYYVESFDFNRQHKPINFHPLTTAESNGLETALATKKADLNFLHIETVLPKSILYLNPVRNGGAVWYTPGRKMPLFFKEELDIPSGVGPVPPLLWRASRRALAVYALPSNRRPTPNSALFQAPFFNTGADGTVCMGSVDIDIAENCSIESFTREWERYFFSSRFTHLNGSVSPVKGNIIQLWQSLIGSKRPFPVEVLLPTTFTLQNIIHDQY